MLVDWLIVVDFLVVFLSPNYDTLEDMPATWRRFLQLDLLAQQIGSSGPPLGCSVQAASEIVTTYFS